jgi:hypothetical protein
MSSRTVARSAATVIAAATLAAIAAAPATAGSATFPDNTGTNTALEAQADHVPYGVGVGRKIG